MSRIELRVALGLFCAISLAIGYYFVARVSNASTLPEYVVKFVPALSEHGVVATFDFVGLGDARPRWVSNVVTLFNVSLRQLLLSMGFFHPALSIYWVLAPLSLLLLSRAVFLLFGSARTAAFVTLLYAASPAFLDPFANYYVAAKPIANVLTILSAYGAAIAFPSPTSEVPERRLIGGLVVGISFLLALLADETGAFIPLLILALLWPRLTSAPKGTQLAVIGGVAAIAFFYALLVIVVFPAINRALGQVSVDFISLATRGIHAALFGIHVDVAAGRTIGYAPFNLLETILSAHAVPGRYVPGNWTSPNSWSFSQWWLRDQIGLILFLIAMIIVWFQASKEARAAASRLSLACVVFILLETLLIYPLAPVLLEVSYYAAPASLYFALVVGIVASSGHVNAVLNVAKWGLLSYLVAVQFSNYRDTAARHPYWSPVPVGWSTVKAIRNQIADGHYSEVLSYFDFRDRRFLWAIEMEIARRAANKEAIDLFPGRSISETIFRPIYRRAYEDGQLRNADDIHEMDEQALVQSKALALDLASFPDESQRSTRGQSGEWRYIRHIDLNGRITELTWFGGLVRQWYSEGRLVKAGKQVCLEYRHRPPECFGKLYRTSDGTIHALDLSGGPVTRFRPCKMSRTSCR